MTPLQAFSFEKAVVLDGATGDVLFEHHAHEKSRVASLTKIMTAVVALEYGHLSDTTLISQRAAEMTGSSVYLNVGQKVTLSDLLYALMLRSGNDASIAIAEMIGGSEAGVVYLMNEKARMLGLHQSTFKNPHGLDEPDHLSSAYDLAILTRHALTVPGFIEISSERAYQSEASTYPWLHKHKLVKYQVEETLLGKTGYTTSAGRTLMTVFRKQHQPIIVVTLNAPNDWTDHQTLFQQAEIKEDPDLGEHDLSPFLGVRVCL
ncbi:MAG: D-alanyl-D-alanine carboxypeptidase family protein [Bacillota bacterium]